MLKRKRVFAWLCILVFLCTGCQTKVTLENVVTEEEELVPVASEGDVMVMELEQYMNNFNYATKELELKPTLTELQTEKVDGIKMYSHTFEDGTSIHIVPDKKGGERFSEIRFDKPLDALSDEGMKKYVSNCFAGFAACTLQFYSGSRLNDYREKFEAAIEKEESILHLYDSYHGYKFSILSDGEKLTFSMKAAPYTFEDPGKLIGTPEALANAFNRYMEVSDHEQITEFTAEPQPGKEEDVLVYHFADQSILELYQNKEKNGFLKIRYTQNILEDEGRNACINAALALSGLCSPDEEPDIVRGLMSEFYGPFYEEIGTLLYKFTYQNGDLTMEIRLADE